MFVAHGVGVDPAFGPPVMDDDFDPYDNPEPPDDSAFPVSLAVPKVLDQEALADLITPLVVVPQDPDEEVPPVDSVSLRLAQRAQPMPPPILPPMPTVRQTYSRKTEKAKLEKWAASGRVSDRVLVKVNDPHGKESVNQWFHSEATLRHCLLPIMRRGFLPVDGPERVMLRRTCRDFNTLFQLLEDYADVDFNSLRGFPKDWKDEEGINLERVRMVSAALLYFEGDAAALAMFMGGPHRAWHRDVPAIIDNLRGKVDVAVVDELECIFTYGIPRFCQATSTEANFQAYLNYGNHTSYSTAPEKSLAALAKDHRKGYVICFDQRIIPFVLNCHVTPQGLVDIDTPYKNPRSIFDSSHRVFSWCMAINDWTSKHTEPQVLCAAAELPFMTWLWNLRADYPYQEIYLMDDDVSGAFRHLKYALLCIAMHTTVQCGFAVFYTGGTFGDNTTPPNWDIIARARQQLARYLWLRFPDVMQHVRDLLPPIATVPRPTLAEAQMFAQAAKDALNPGVFDVNGKRKPPQFDHHVDDCAFADIEPFVERGVAASTMALYSILGYPADNVPDPQSKDKLETLYGYSRKFVGRQWNTRTMTVGMPEYKRLELIQRLDQWLLQSKFTLVEAAELTGILENHTRYAKWARAWFFAIQNDFRDKFKKAYYAAARVFDKLAPAKQRQYTRELPQALWKRIAPLLQRDKARLLWHMKWPASLSPDAVTALRVIRAYLLETDSPWEAKIGFLIPRVAHIDSTGDASLFAGGAYSRRLKFWFQVRWSKRVVKCTQLTSTQPNFIHINALEFLVLILEVAAVIQALRDLADPEIDDDAADYFPDGKVPVCPILLAKADNTSAVAWLNKASTASGHGQRLIPIYSALLRLEEVGVNGDYLEGGLNDQADMISRPTDLSLSPADMAEQLFQTYDEMRTWRRFQPHPELLRLLSLSLFTEPQPIPLQLPNRLGQFVPTGSTISALPMI